MSNREPNNNKSNAPLEDYKYIQYLSSRIPRHEVKSEPGVNQTASTIPTNLFNPIGR